MKFLRLKLFIFTMAMCSTITGAQRAPQIVDLDALMGSGFVDSIKQAYYQVMFSFTENIDLKLYESDNTNWKLKFGRVLLKTYTRPGFIMTDHFSVAGSASIPVGGAISIGGNGQIKLLRFRSIPQAESADLHLTEDLKDWDPYSKADAEMQEVYLENTAEWINKIESEYMKGNTAPAKIVFGDDVPSWGLKDLIAGLKVPVNMPWTSRRALNDSKFKVRDIASYNVQGGIFARVGADFDLTGVTGPTLGVFLRGHYNYSILKVNSNEFLLRVESSQNKGYDLNFDTKFKIPIAEGLLFGKDINYSIRPISIFAESYRSKLFRRIYRVSLKSDASKKAYDAAMFGNLTKLDDLAEIENSGVAVISERYRNGMHEHTRIRAKIWPLKLESRTEYDSTTTDFWDERGQFKYFVSSALKTELMDFSVPYLGFRLERTNQAYSQAYPISPDGPYAPRMQWRIEEVNMNIKNHEADDLIKYLQAFIPESSSKDLSQRLAPDRKARAMVQIEVPGQGFNSLSQLTELDIWKKAAHLIVGDDMKWSTRSKRMSWLEQVGEDPLRLPLWRHEAKKLIDRIDKIAKFHKKKVSAQDYKAWVDYSQLWVKADMNQPFFPRLLVELLGPEDRYVLLEVESETEYSYWNWESGDKDLTIYPDDWEYFTLPGFDQ